LPNPQPVPIRIIDPELCHAVEGGFQAREVETIAAHLLVILMNVLWIQVEDGCAGSLDRPCYAVIDLPTARLLFFSVRSTHSGAARANTVTVVIPAHHVAVRADAMRVMAATHSLTVWANTVSVVFTSHLTAHRADALAVVLTAHFHLTLR
jgi:hypothetical protein